MKKHGDNEIVFDAITGRRVGGDSNVVELRPWRASKPTAVDGDAPSMVERLTIRADLGGMTVEEVCDRAAAEELANLAARLEQYPVAQSDDDDI